MPSSPDHAPRRALVSGAAGALGSCIAHMLSARGDRVCAIVRRSNPRATALERELRRHKRGDSFTGGQLLRGDLALPEDCADIVERARASMGGIDTIINAAGSFHRVPLAHETPRDFRAAFDDNFHSAVQLCLAAAPTLRESPNSRVLNFTIARVERLAAPPAIAAHYCAKAALLAFTRAFASELAPSGATVNAIALGFIASEPPDANRALDHQPLDDIPAGRLGTPDDVLGLVSFLLSEQASYITGANICVSGGW